MVGWEETTIIISSTFSLGSRRKPGLSIIIFGSALSIASWMVLYGPISESIINYYFKTPWIPLS